VLSLLFFGFVVGVSHAFEADHLAAVSALVSGKSGWRTILWRGSQWGLGHAVTLFAVTALALATGRHLSAQLASGLELIVGVTLIYLGIHVMVRLRRDHVHIHTHKHSDGRRHVHFHRHDTDSVHSRHSHDHHDTTPLQSLAVGMVHGLAGSAALIVFTATQISTPQLALGYVALFGLGSLAGMVAVSAAMALPLVYSARVLGRANRALQWMISLATLALGALMATTMALQLVG